MIVRVRLTLMPTKELFSVKLTTIAMSPFRPDLPVVWISTQSPMARTVPYLSVVGERDDAAAEGSGVAMGRAGDEVTVDARMGELVRS